MHIKPQSTESQTNLSGTIFQPDFWKYLAQQFTVSLFLNSEANIFLSFIKNYKATQQKIYVETF